MTIEVDDGRMHGELWLATIDNFPVFKAVMDGAPDEHRVLICEWIVDAYSLGFSHGRAVAATEAREDFERFLQRRTETGNDA